MKYIYIAGPYTKGDIAVNVRNAIDAASVILNAGFIPYVPHLAHFWHLLNPQAYETWITLDLEWVKKCDAVIRLPGESNGADGEVSFAVELGLPVYYSVEQFLLATECAKIDNNIVK